MITIGLDCETALTEPGLQAPSLACVAIGPSDYQIVLHHTNWIETVRELLTTPDILITGHYIAYDFAVLINEAPSLIPLVFDAYEQNRITCTLCRQKLLDIAAGVYRGFDDIDGKTVKLTYSLEACALRHLNRQLDKNTWRLRYGELRSKPLIEWPEASLVYVKEDVRAAVDVHAKQEESAYYLEDQYRQARASFWLRLMANWGLRTDAAGIRALAERTRREYDSIAADLRAAKLLRPDHHKRDGTIKEGSRDTKVAQARVVAAYNALGKEVPLTEGGKKGIKQPCLDKVTCQESGDPLLIKYASLSSLKTVLSKDIPMLSAGIHLPIHSTFEDILETGRTSSYEPNVQNPKRKGGIRECFVPRCLRCSRVHDQWDYDLGRCFRCGNHISVMWSCDYGGLELCTLAQACMTILGYSRLADALNSGKDPHLLMAAAILGRPYEELKAIKKKGPGRNCIQKFGKCFCPYCIVYDARQTGKVANFGFPGGLGAAALVFFALNNYDVHLTEQEAKKLKRLWLELWPEMREYFAWISNHSDRSFPQIEQLFVRRFRVGRYTELCNTIFQGLGADIAKKAGWAIYRGMYDPTVDSILYGSRGVNFVHDEHVGESPEHIAHECAFEVRRLMLEAAKPYLPDVKIDVEPALMRRYSKEAGPQYDSSGRLVPWTGQKAA